MRPYPGTPAQPESEAPTIHAHCDGGSRGNPGPSGYGAVVTSATGEPIAQLSEYLGIRTNNYAEYSGLLAVLAYALEHQHPRLKVVSDSELMVKQIQGKYKVNSPDLKPLWEEAKRRIAQLEAFEITHALRHKNKDADALANQAMDRGMRRNVFVSVPADTSAAPVPVKAPAPIAPKPAPPKPVATEPAVPATPATRHHRTGRAARASRCPRHAARLHQGWHHPPARRCHLA
jgi:probable phosphoglycerate mutase